MPRPRYHLRTLSLVVAGIALGLAVFKATAWSTAGTALILVVWVVVPGIVAGVWKLILRLEPSRPLLALLAFFWTFVTIAVVLCLLVSTAFLVYASRYGIPPCGRLG